MSVVQLAPNAVFAGRYRVVRCLRTGGMGAVFEVVDRVTRKRRAMKVMPAEVLESEDLERRFQLETTITAKVQSEHVVEVFDAGVDEASRSPFLVMELLVGTELASLYRKHGPMPASDVVYLLRQVALGLERTHAAGIVHRDLKPDNVFLTRRDDGTIHIKLLDFGIAKLVAGDTHPERTKVLGTPLYMAPEQLTGDGRVGPGADLYALGHLAFTLLCGEAYWHQTAEESANVYGLMTKVMKGIDGAASDSTDLPPELDDWFARAVASAPERRFGSATDQIDALAEALGADDATLSDHVIATFDALIEDAQRGAEASAELLTTSGAVLGHRASAAGGERRWLGMALAAIVASIGTVAVLQFSASPPSGSSSTSPSPRDVPTGDPSALPGTAAPNSPEPTASVPKSVATVTPSDPSPSAAPPAEPARPAPPSRPRALPKKSPAPPADPDPEPEKDPLKIR